MPYQIKAGKASIENGRFAIRDNSDRYSPHKPMEYVKSVHYVILYATTKYTYMTVFMFPVSNDR
jgi:hypothetical protein